MKKHYVTFLSPGTFVAETSTREIESWDVTVASEMARGITERHSATPYAFYFTTKERGESDLDSKEVAHSAHHYLGGTIQTLEEVKERADPNERILLANMRSNGCSRIIVNNNSWKVTRPFNDDDILLDWRVSND